MEFEELFSWLKSNTSASPFVLDRLCSVLVDMDLPGDVGVPDAAELPDGGVMVAWDDGGEIASLEVLPDGSVDAFHLVRTAYQESKCMEPGELRAVVISIAGGRTRE